jgi:hypothetical protein
VTPRGILIVEIWHTSQNAINRIADSSTVEWPRDAHPGCEINLS